MELRGLLEGMLGPAPAGGGGRIGTADDIAGPSPNVTILAVNFAYRDLAANFVCGLQRLGMDKRYLVFAMDRAAFEYLRYRGVNVFYHSKGGEGENGIPMVGEKEDSVDGNEDDVGYAFGTEGFVKTSRRKSMLVSEVLAFGYDVLFSDVDVILLRDPHEGLRVYAEDFLIMSDALAHNETQALNYNINSGFYFVRGRARNFVAMRAFVKYSEKTRRSEQKAFNHVLCGAFKGNIAGPGWRFGSNRCFYRIMGGVTTRVLSTEEFENGSDKVLFSLSPSVFLAVAPNLRVVHVNYINGRNEKIDTMKSIGQWFYKEGLSLSSDGCSAKPIGDDMNIDPSDDDFDQAVLEARSLLKRAVAPVDNSGEDPGDRSPGEGVDDGAAESLLLQQVHHQAVRERAKEYREVVGILEPGGDSGQVH